MEKRIRRSKITIGILIALLIIMTCFGYQTSAFAETSSDSGDSDGTSSLTTDSAIKSLTGILDGNDDVGKEETVYVISGADGTTQKVIVSDWLKNTDGSSTITDKSSLSNIENVKGDETYETGKDGELTWNAGGSDIYYQGETDADLPVEMKVTYTLNGKEISPEDLAGQSGEVTIKFDFDNNQKETVTVDGETYDMYVPYAMLTGMILDNDSFSDVTVSNGKIINDGDGSIVIGFALPGMQENLDLSKDQLDIPSSIEITANVTDFELATTVTVATNEIFNSVDLSDVSDVDSLKDQLDEFVSAAKQLVDGSSDLYDGITTLLEGSDELIDGVDQLKDGSITLAEGTSDLSDGASDLNTGAQSILTAANLIADGAAALQSGAYQLALGAGQLSTGANDLATGASDLSTGADSLYAGAGQLNSGVGEVNSGLSQLSSNSETLNAGAAQVFQALIDQANTQLAASGLNVETLTISNYDSVLDGQISALSADNVRAYATAQAQQTVEAQVRANQAAIAAAVQAAYSQQITAAVLESQGLTAETYQAGIEAGLITTEQQEQIDQAISAQLNSSDIQSAISAETENQIQSLISENMASAAVQQGIEEAVAAAQSGATSLTALKSQLDSYNQFYQGLLQYTAGVDSAYAGSQQLSSGAQSLEDGAKSLSDGASQLSSGATTLAGGASDLVDGANFLYAGTTELASGTSQLSDGAGTLAEGTASLSDGAAQVKAGADALSEGLITLRSSCDDLVDGVEQLQDGAMQLSDGMKEFYEEGVEKLVDAFEGDLGTLVNRIQAVSDASKAYTNFSGIADGTKGSVKFIYRTDSIEK